MPSSVFPPTPGASVELNGKDDTSGLSTASAIDLPPPACAHRPESPSCKEPQRLNPLSPHSSPYILSEHSTKAPKGISRKRTASQATSVPEQLSLPPPPPRSRKIIQMKPRDSRAKSVEKHDPEKPLPANSNKSTGGAMGKKKQGSTSSAGKKTARKTAHSLIERRRRSKINEEFGVLKDMIPACAGQEMHKLAILQVSRVTKKTRSVRSTFSFAIQASIEYMRYLEKCLADVKGGSQASSPEMSPPPPPPPQSRSRGRTAIYENAGTANSRQRENIQRPPDRSRTFDHESIPPSVLTSPASSGVALSPAFSTYAYNHMPRGNSASTLDLPSPASTQFPNERLPTSKNSSGPAISPLTYSTQASPAILPQSSHSSAPSELDQEASAALLMLNASDRRTSVTKSIGESRSQGQSRPRGISVKDLLRS